jgi:NhaA family Na+:H+ antiporter
VRPLCKFLHVQAASGIVLLAAAVVALLWANSPWSESYEHVWHTPIAISVGSATFEESLHFWINDGLMVLFFFVVGLEIRREIHEGELSDLRRAALPFFAAVGGMVAPALIYIAFAGGSQVSGGWGVPMATDIAFAVGVLALLGKRVPAALRVLLLALAIIDDVGAILVIAIFLSSGVKLVGLGLGALGVLSVLVLQRLGVRRALAYVPSGVVLWVGMLQAGVHPTIAGVILGLLTPARSWFGRRGFLSVARRTVSELSKSKQGSEERFNHGLQKLEDAQREALPPVVRLTDAMHGWVAFGIMPLFALANSGVDLRSVDLSGNGVDLIMLGSCWACWSASHLASWAPAGSPSKRASVACRGA